MMYNVASPSLASRTSPITPPHLVHFYAPTLPHLPCPCPSLQKTATCTHSAPPPLPLPLPASRQPQHAPRLCQQQRLRPGGAGVCMRASSLSTHATPHAMQHMHVLSCMCTHTHTHHLASSIIEQSVGCDFVEYCHVGYLPCLVHLRSES